MSKSFILFSCFAALQIGCANNGESSFTTAGTKCDTSLDCPAGQYCYPSKPNSFCSAPRTYAECRGKTQDYCLVECSAPNGGTLYVQDCRQSCSPQGCLCDSAVNCAEYKDANNNSYGFSRACGRFTENDFMEACTQPTANGVSTFPEGAKWRQPKPIPCGDVRGMLAYCKFNTDPNGQNCRDAGPDEFGISFISDNVFDGCINRCADFQFADDERLLMVARGMCGL